MTEAVLEAFSDVLRYPGEGRAPMLPDWIDAIRVEAPAVADKLDKLRDYSTAHEEGELEELFVRTFENNAERALELGWHLHGENYARGGFMARMRGLLRQLEIAESAELPDHVSHLLGIISHAKPVLARALASTVVAPALGTIETGFKDKENPYYDVIVGLHAYIDERWPSTGLPPEPGPQAYAPSRHMGALPKGLEGLNDPPADMDGGCMGGEWTR